MRRVTLFFALLAVLVTGNAFAISVDIKDFGLTKGEGLDEVKRPEAIAADDKGHLLVTDRENKKLVLFNTDGKFRFAFPSKQSKKLEQPTACAIGPDSTFFVIDPSKKAVYKFDVAGERQSVGSQSIFPEPIAVAADPSGRVYVIDKKQKRLVGLSASGDQLPGYQVPLNNPLAVAADKLGRAYVADAGKGILFVFKADGTIERELSLSTGAAKGGKLTKPVGIAVNTHGEIFLLDQNDRRVFYKQGVEDANWQPLFGKEGSGQGEFKRPVAIAVAGRERVFVLDAEAPKISRATLGDLPSIPPLGQTGLLSAQDTITIIPDVATSFKQAQIVISRVDKEAGRIYFSVLRPNGMPEAGLIASDFRFALAGNPVTGVKVETFADHPEARLMAVLGFGTTQLVPLEVQRAKTAVVENFVSDLIESKPDKAAILTFQNSIDVPAHFTSDPFRLKEELNKVGFEGSSLKFFDAILAGKDLIAQTDTAGYGALIYLLDGRDDGSKYDIFQLEREASEGNFPPVYVVGIGVAEGSQLATELAKVAELTKGAYFFSQPLGENYAKIYKHVNRLLEHQYVATFPGPLAAGPVEVQYTRSDGMALRGEAALKGAPSEPADRETMAPSGMSVLMIILLVLLIILVIVLIILLIRALVRKSRAVPSGWRLAFRRGVLRGKSVEIKRAEIRIGTASNNEIVVSDDRVSRNHAVVRWAGGRFEIEDLNSTNHTFVNGKPVTKAALRAGDLISLANATDMVLEGGA